MKKHNVFRVFMALVCALTMTVTIFMPKVSVQAEGADDLWHEGFVSGDTQFYIADETYNGKPVFVIEQTEGTYSTAERNMALETNYRYTISAMVKYEGDEGGVVGVGFDGDGSFTSSSDWTYVEYTMDSRGGEGDIYDHTVCLFLGNEDNPTVGKAYFTDIKIYKEEYDETNDWNFLILIFRNAKIDNAKTYDGDVRDWEVHMTNEELQLTKDAVNTLPNLFETMSEGKMQVEDFDIITVEKTLTELTYLSDDYLYGMSQNDPEFAEILDLYIGDKHYDQIICIANLEGVSGVGGLGGTAYKDAQFCQMTSIAWFTGKAGTTGVAGAIVHEVLHGLESRTIERDPDKYVSLHDGEVNGYEYDEEYEYLEWYQAYMRCEVQGHLGVSPLAYINKRNQHNVLVSDSMESTFTKKSSGTTDDSKDTERVEMFRLYNPNSGEHFYTKDVNEKDTLVSYGWRYEGVGWTAPGKSETPVYRLYNKYGGEHHYTTNAVEKEALVAAGWTDEGIGWYSDVNMTVPVYREYNPNAFANNHNYTTDTNEHETLLSYGWRDEGIAWYGIN